MPAPGAKPKAGEKHGRTPPALEWVEVVDRPYEGWRPDLPETRRVEWFDQKSGRQSSDQQLREETAGWWDAVSTMPHCVLWSKSDWLFALSTAFIADMVFSGDRQAAGELRQREKIMGVTLDARRDLRIRYVDPPESKPQTGSTVTPISSRRAQMIAGA